MFVYGLSSDNSYKHSTNSDKQNQPSLMAGLPCTVHTVSMDKSIHPSSVMRVYVVEDSASICERIVRMVNEIPDMQVVGTASAVSDAIDGIATCTPDAVILDLRLAGGSGISVLQHVKAVRPRLKVMVLTNFSSDQYRDLSQRLGADAFLDKSNDFMRITEILRGWCNVQTVELASHHPLDTGERK
jgi:response regulator of citrate/malate metabolism